MAERKSWDSAYKYLFSSRQVFHQFLTRFVEEDFVQGLAVDDVELVDKSFVSDELLDRESDIIYKVTLPGARGLCVCAFGVSVHPGQNHPGTHAVVYPAAV